MFKWMAAMIAGGATLIMTGGERTGADRATRPYHRQKHACLCRNAVPP